MSFIKTRYKHRIITTKKLYQLVFNTTDFHIDICSFTQKDIPAIINAGENDAKILFPPVPLPIV